MQKQNKPLILALLAGLALSGAAQAALISVDYLYGTHTESPSVPVPSVPWYLKLSVTIPDNYQFGANATTLLSSVSGASLSGIANVLLPWAGGTNFDLAANNGLQNLSVITDGNGNPTDVWFDSSDGILRYHGANAGYSFVNIIAVCDGHTYEMGCLDLSGNPRSGPVFRLVTGSATATQLNFDYQATSTSPNDPPLVRDVPDPETPMNGVPEPATLLLVSLGLVGLGAMRRRSDSVIRVIRSF